MGINKFYELASADFEIMGEDEETWEVYQKGKSYNAIIVRRKKE